MILLCLDLKKERERGGDALFFIYCFCSNIKTTCTMHRVVS